MRELATVIISKNEGEELRRTVDCMLEVQPTNSEIIVVDDASTDDSCAFLTGATYADVRYMRSDATLGVAKARNFGASATDATYLVFSDAHVRVQPGWWEGFRAALETTGVGAVGPGFGNLADIARAPACGATFTRPTLKAQLMEQKGTGAYDVPLLGGGFLGVRNDLWRQVGMFDAGMQGLGFEDSEFCMRLWLFGYRCVVQSDVVVLHHFRDAPPYYVDTAWYIYNRLRFATLHLTGARLADVFSESAALPVFREALHKLADSDVIARKDWIESWRRHTDEWFFDKFSIDLSLASDFLARLTGSLTALAIPQDSDRLCDNDLLLLVRRGKVLMTGSLSELRAEGYV
ncbi:glycosyltransferase [Nonomuraea sp. NPDC049758]|uniref:glycosyltransferase family 2 protein n=1 Tax=Nonomuraea sp. NPDC049758 TaxID=3154360 RepID=UPI0034260D59